VLNADLTYGLCFLGFVIAATWALTLFHLRREMEDNLLVKHAADRASERVEVRRILDSKRIVGGRFFLGTGLLSFGVFVASAVAFLALPRVGFGFFLKNRGGLTLTGFADRVKLGGHGVLKNDDTVVMRVEVDAKLGGREAPEIHWRGVAFDYYSRGEWGRQYDAAPDTIDVVDYPRSGTERHTLQWSRQPPYDAEELERVGTHQDVWLEPLDSDVMFGASTPRVFERAQQLRTPRRKVMKNDELRIEHSSTIHYVVYSQLDRPSPDVLRLATGALPRHYEVYLQYPASEITQRTIALVHQITDRYTDNYDKAAAIQQWLDTNLTYTLVLAEPHRGQDPIDFFLFDRKQGHCEYFASAFAIMARIAGIPTRQVNGFLGGEWNEYQGYVAVRAGDAHSWDEVYFPGAGWVTFDPTPPDRHDPLGRGGTGWRARLSRFMDTLRFQWTKWVIEYDLVAQLELFKGIGAAIKRGILHLRDGLLGILKLWPLLAVVVAGIVAWIMRRRRRAEAMTPGTARARARSRSPIAQIYDHVLRMLAKRGIAREPATTPREYAARLTAPTIAAHVRELTDLYYAAEWGGTRDPAAEHRAHQLSTEIRTTLDAAPR
jgi:transglutaminase-like putative cysteine protease